MSLEVEHFPACRKFHPMVSKAADAIRSDGVHFFPQHMCLHSQFAFRLASIIIIIIYAFAF